jgi:hypothetical protein
MVILDHAYPAVTRERWEAMIVNSGFGVFSKKVTPRACENVGRRVQSPSSLGRVVGLVAAHHFKPSLACQRSSCRLPQPTTAIQRVNQRGQFIMHKKHILKWAGGSHYSSACVSF